MRRLSVMSLQGVGGDPVTSIPDVTTGAGATNGAGSAPTLVELPSGIPVIELANQPSASGSAGNPTLYIQAKTAPTRTIVVVGRLVSQPSNAESAPTEQSLQIVTGSVGRTQGMSVRRSQLGTPVIQAYADTGGVATSTSPLSIAGGLQWIAVTFNGASSVIQVDGETTPVNLPVPTAQAEMIVGYAKRAGGTFQLVEAMQYDVALTGLELSTLRAHLRAIYQF